MENYSLSDIKSIVGNDGFSGNSAWVLLILFLLIGGNGFGFGRNNDVATTTGMNFDSIGKQINAIGDGISSLGYNQLAQMNNNTTSINGNIVSEGRNIQTQLANMCCSSKELFAQTNAAIHAEGEATRNLIQQNQMDMLKGRISQLELSQAVSGVVRYPQATTYSSGSNPFCSCSCANV